MLVAVQEAVGVAQAAENLHLVNHDQVEGREVEVERGERAQVLASKLGVCLMQGERDASPEQHPQV